MEEPTCCKYALTSLTANVIASCEFKPKLDQLPVSDNNPAIGIVFSCATVSNFLQDASKINRDKTTNNPFRMGYFLYKLSCKIMIYF